MCRLKRQYSNFEVRLEAQQILRKSRVQQLMYLGGTNGYATELAREF